MVEDNDERQNYREKLQVILHTCLLYNSSKALGNHVNYVLHGKGNKGFKDKNKPLSQLRFIYKGLCTEVKDNTHNDLNLDELLNDYKIVSKYYNSLRRSYSIDMQAKDQKNKNLLFALLDYTLVDKEKAKQKYASILGINKYETIAKEFAKKSAEIELFEPLILLLMTRLLPQYNTKQTEVDNIFDDFYMLVDFLREYSQQSLVNSFIGDAPFLTRWINEIQKKREEMLKKKENVDIVKLEDDSQILNRLNLIYGTANFLGPFYIFSNKQNTGEYINSLDPYFPDLDGFWTITKEKTTTFWIFEKQYNCFFLTEYEKKTDSFGRPTLEYTCYECEMYYEHDNILFCVTHPKASYNIVKNDSLNNELKSFFYVNMRKIRKGNNTIIESIELEPSCNPNGWFSPTKFYRDKDESDHKADITRSLLVNKFPETEYTFDWCLAAITPQFLYLEINKKDRMLMHASDKETTCIFLMVPKNLNPALQDIDFKTPFGIITFSDKTVYIGSANHLLYYEITFPEQREKLGIKLVDGVRGF